MPGAFAEKWRFDLDGGTVALDFVNTVSGMRGFEPREHLFGWADLVWWAEQAKLLSRSRAHQLQAWVRLHPRRTAQAVEGALRRREALHSVAMAAVEKRDPPAAALREVNEWIAEALAHRRLRPAGSGRFELEYDDDGDFLAFLRPVAVDAQELLQNELARTHICDESAIGRCGWLFVDETRNHSRRYCSMKDCGNRAKQRRHWQRKKAG